MIHALKTTPKYFEDVISGMKPFEVRKNDRDYREHDYIALNEYDPEAVGLEQERYSGRSALFLISYVLNDPQFCKDSYVILGLIPCAVEVVGVEGMGVMVLRGQARGIEETEGGK